MPAQFAHGRVLQVQPPVQGCHRAPGPLGEEGKVQHVRMEMEDVELIGASTHLGQHRHMSRQIGFQRHGIQADRLIPDGYQTRSRPGLGGREQGDLVAKIDQGVGKVGHHALGPPVKARRNGFIEGGNLRNFHGTDPERRLSQPQLKP